MNDNTASQPKVTPARRRQGRNAGRSAAHKAYASENDVANFDPPHEGSPRTPFKADMDSPASHGNQQQSKQRSRKQRTKNTPASPESGRNGQHTPPHTSASMKTTNMQAFAGATFHASPAPSALPLPSFLAKPLTDSPGPRQTPDAMHAPSPSTDTDVPTPSHVSSNPVHQASPLDFMFRAHRQEVERQRQESPLAPRQTPRSATSQPSRSPFESNGVSNPSTVPQTARSQFRQRPNGIDAAELDGTPGRPMGPAFSTPYSERIKAARSSSTRSASAQDLSHQPSGPAPEDPTEALKKFLFDGRVLSGPNTTTPSFAPNGSIPAQQVHTAPTAAPVSHPTTVHDNRSNNIQAMENDLRRILKLDVAPGPSGPQQRLFS